MHVGVGQFSAAYYLPFFHLDAMFSNVICKELHRRLMEKALFSFKEQMEFYQAFQDLHKVLVIFSPASGVDKDFINKVKCKPTEELLEYLIHEVTEYGIWRGRLQSHMQCWGVTSYM